MEYLMFNEGPHGQHRINILFSQFTDVGIGIYVDAKGWMWLTEDFGSH
jgi:hypothetical protein